MAQLKESEDGKEVEVHIDGSFVAGWAIEKLPREFWPVVASMLDEAVQKGRRLQAADIREALLIRE